MRKNFRMYLTLALVMLGVMSVSAGDRIPVDAEHFTFYNHGNSEDDPDFGWGADAQETDAATGENGNFLIDQANGCPIGDTNCNAWIDLGAYSKMYVKMAGCDENGNLNDSNPRIFINRTTWNGQFNSDKSAAKCLVIPNAGTWAEDFYIVEDDGTIVIDLTKIGKEWGFVHFHSIKGSAWNTKAIVYSIEVEKAAASQQIGWVNLINNSDMEGTDVSSFFTKIAQGNPEPSEILDGVGVDGSRGIKVAATAKVADNWDNQFWFRFNEPLPAGTKYRVSFDYRAAAAAAAETQAHAEPSDYIHYELFGDINFDEQWSTFTKEGEVTASQSTDAKLFQSVAFNLNKYAEANDYYFDNIKFEVYKYGTTAEFGMIAVKLDFGFDTNLADLVKASGKRRLLYPEGCAKVTVNGTPVTVTSVEGYPDGGLYIFLALDDAIANENAVVQVSFNNPADEKYHLIYTSGPLGDVANITGVDASYNSGLESEYPYEYMVPELVKADPENGSFNLPNSIKEFKLTFDKAVNVERLKATINGEAMTIAPATGTATEITLTRQGSGDLASGKYIIKVTEIYPVEDLGVSGEVTINVSVGKVEADPSQVPTEMLAETFNATAANNIPEGYFVKFGDEEREGGSSYGSGPRMFDFAAGGDFTKGLYFREGYVEYGSTEGYDLTLKAGEKYQISFNSAMWKDGGGSMRFEIFDEAGEQVLVQMVSNTPNVNGSQAAVNGSTATKITFIPEATGNYVIRWTSANNETADASYMEILLANPSVMFIPDIPGIEETQLLNTALAEAKSTRDGNADGRYAGEAFNTLDAAITKYDAEKDSYTNPSDYETAAAALNAAVQAVKDHRVLCDDYDKQIKAAIDVERQNKEKKFAKTSLYAELQALVAKYHGSSEWLDMTDWDNAEEGTDTIWQLKYAYDVLMTDDSLKVAVPELTAIAEKTGLLFTEGKSTPDNSNGGKGTGVAVLTERIRLGAEALKVLGVPADDEMIQIANDVLSDDDSVAEAIKKRITTILYGHLKDANNDLFTPVLDENTMEDITPEYDMTVFVKNPNVYKQQPNGNYSEENIPGWIVPEGFNRPGLTTGWNAAKNVEDVAEDCMFQTWGSSYRAEQTIEDLPVGVYTVKMAFGERQGEEESYLEDSYVYAQTTDMEEPLQAGASVIGQAFPFVEGGPGSLSIENVVVTDGYLTIGVNAGPSSHTFFNEVRLVIIGAAEGVDYGPLYQEVVDGVEDVKAEQVRAIQLYDLNGRRITTARQGVVIVKKIMSDGSVRTEKVVKK